MFHTIKFFPSPGPFSAPRYLGPGRYFEFPGGMSPVDRLIESARPRPSTLPSSNLLQRIEQRERERAMNIAREFALRERERSQKREREMSILREFLAGQREEEERKEREIEATHKFFAMLRGEK